MRSQQVVSELAGMLVLGALLDRVRERWGRYEVPDWSALWHERCPENPEFGGAPLATLASARTRHWFDPCELLLPDARSEYLDEFRVRQCGGGWMPRKPPA